jgi:glutaredoxin
LCYIDFVSSSKTQPKSVRLFIKPWCGWCDKAAEWLDARGIQYETLDVIANPAANREMRDLSGQGLAPVIDVDGEILADFDPQQLAEFWKRFE